MLIDSLDLKGHILKFGTLVVICSEIALFKKVFGKSNKPKVENKLFPINSKLRIEEAPKYECRFGSQ